MAAECLELQELKHRGVQRLGYAVDLVKEEDAATQARTLHVIVYGAYNFTHRVFGSLVLEPFELAMRDARKAKGALARVMRHRIRHDAYAKFLSYLLDNCRLADARRTNEEHRTLARWVDDVHARIILLQIRINRILDLIFRCLNVHHARSNPFYTYE